MKIAAAALTVFVAVVLCLGCEAAEAPAAYVETGLAAKDTAKELAIEISMRAHQQSFEIKHSRPPESLEEFEEFVGDRMPDAPKGKVWALVEGTVLPVDE